MTTLPSPADVLAVGEAPHSGHSGRIDRLPKADIAGANAKGQWPQVAIPRLSGLWRQFHDKDMVPAVERYA